jgi:hypothetical protein
MEVIGYLHTAPTLLIGNEAKMFDIILKIWGEGGGRFSAAIVEQNRFSAVLRHSIICCIKDCE